MSSAIPEKYRDLFSKRAFASLATLMPDGHPQVTRYGAIWKEITSSSIPQKGVKRIKMCAATRTSR